MKRSTKIILGSVVGLGLVGAVTAKQFGACEYGPDQRADWISQRVSDELNLTTVQQSELQNLKGSALAAFGSMREQKPAFSEIEALFATEFDQAKAIQLVESRSQTFTQKAPELIAAFANFYNTLDDSQRAEVSEMVENRMQHGPRGRRHGSWGHDRGFFHE